MHKIEKRDAQYGVVMAWHKLTRVRDVITMKEVCDYDIVPREVRYADENGNFDKANLVGRFIPVATDDGLPVGKEYNADSYGLRTHKQNWEFVSRVLSGADYRIVSAGTVMNRGRSFIVAEFPTLAKFNVGNREFQPYLNVLDSTDKSLGCTFLLSSICTVCNNTLQMNRFAEVPFKYTFFHNVNVNKDIEVDFEPILEHAVGVTAEFKSSLASLEAIPCKADTARQILTGFESTTVEKLATRTANRIDEEMALFANGAGNRGETMLDLVSSVTDFYTHANTGAKDLYRQFTASEYGSSADTKESFVLSVREDSKRESLRARGEAILQLN